MKEISIQGARTHNLKNIDVKIPRDKLVVITGLSGSGKSSLAFDTLYAEGQRRYVESLSTYARQFLSMMDKPDVDHIEGLSPAISIEQKATSHNPRSTTGTVTEIYDYLRLLFARTGKPKCPYHDNFLEAKTVSQMVDQILALPINTKLIILAPVVSGKKGEHTKLLESLLAQGFIKAQINGETYELEEPPKLSLHKKHNIDIIIDRLKIKSEHKTRLADSIETAINLSNGLLKVNILDTNEELIFSAKFSCPECGYSLTELEPRIFSFNNPKGACSGCDGIGIKQFMDPEIVVHDPSLSLSNGAIRGWDKNSNYYFQLLSSVAKHFNFDLDKPFNKLTKKQQNIILYGSDDIILFSYSYNNKNNIEKHHEFEGVIPNMERRYKETDSDYMRTELAKFLSKQSCPDCDGTRLNLGARNVFVDDITLPEVVEKDIDSCIKFFKKLKLDGWRHKVAKKILKEIITRLEFLSNVGLDYLTLNRSADTLSGGEAQRIRLASQIGAGLVGVMYVLDEPSIGLHQKDNSKLIKTLINLRDMGNTVIVVEHDEEAILTADHLIDIGPGAGIHGGKIIAQGTPKQVMQNPKSLTGKYLSGNLKINTPKERRISDEFLTLVGAKEHNLKNVTVDFPIGVITCVTGLSGSGKSTLINSTLYPVASKILNKAKPTYIGEHKEIKGLDKLDKVINISQNPIGRTPRSNPATYTGLFTDIRDLFANTPEAKTRGYKPGRFSFNVKGGRCEACSGDGVIKVEMHFLSDVYVACDVCHGKRYNRETLEIYYKSKNIHEVLDMSVEEALDFYKAVPSIKKKLETLVAVGLDYIKLGQGATTLSGGEAQRIKLAKELAKRDTGKTLYILDEPTTGLHFHDVNKLLDVLQTLCSHGNTIIIIEHNLDVIKTADYIVDLGPCGGKKGGKIIATGTPEEIAANNKSDTGKFLKELL